MEAPTSVSPFFRLPPELRDKIYDFLLDGAVFVDARDGTLQLHLEYPAQDQERNSFYDGRWLLTSRAILTEARRQFYRKAICTSYTQPADTNPTSPAFPIFDIARVKSIYHRRNSYPDILLDAAFDPHRDGRLFAVRDHSSGCLEDYSVDELHSTPSWIRPTNRDLVASGKGSVVVPDYSACATNRFPLKKAPALGPLIEKLRGGEHGLKEFGLGLILPDILRPWQEYIFKNDVTEELSGIETWNVDFSYLENLGRGLERVEFFTEIEVWRVKGTEDKLYKDVFGKIQGEMVRVGKVLVGGCSEDKEGSSGWALRDWVEKITENERSVIWHVEIARGKSGGKNGELKYKGLKGFEECFIDVDAFQAFLFD